MEGCGFRDLKSEFEARSAAILGVSFDTAEDNKAFAEKFDFNYPLLCDTDKALGAAYGACADESADYANRITVVVGPDGTVVRVYPEVSAKTHPEEVLADLKAMVG